MKKIFNLILWILEIILLLFTAASIVADPGIPASAQDLIFLRLSMALLYLIPAVCILIEIDPFKIKKHLPLVKSKRISAHLLFVLICAVSALLATTICAGMISSDLKNAIAARNTAGQDAKNEAESVQESQNETADEMGETGTDAESSAETEQDKPSPEPKERDDGIIIVEEAEPEKPRPIEKETYSFDDADYSLNGVLIHIDSITLDRNYKPPGYFVDIFYTLENQNSSDAVFRFSGAEGNRFVYNGDNAPLGTAATLSNKQKNSFHLKGYEKSDQLIGKLCTQSLSYTRGLDGIDYGPIDVGELYSGEQISLDVKVFVHADGTEESMTVTFEIEL